MQFGHLQRLIYNILGLFKEIGDTIIEKNEMKSFIEQDLANIAWSYAVSNGDAPSVFNDAFTKVLLREENKFNIEELRQLYQWHLWQTREMIYNGLPTMLAGIHRAIKHHRILKKMLSDNLLCLGRILLKSFSLRVDTDWMRLLKLLEGRLALRLIGRFISSARPQWQNNVEV